MDKYIYRFWNTIKIPLVILIAAILVAVFKELSSVGSYTFLCDLEFWNGFLVSFGLIVIPSISAVIDKWLRDQGIYLEQILNKFRLPK